MGLKSHLRDQDSQVAEDERILKTSRAWLITRLVLLEPYHSFDKGKLVERRGRKAMGLKSRLTGSGQPGCRKRIKKFAGPGKAPLSKWRKQWRSVKNTFELL